VLKLLYKAYAGKVKLVYIDPPYNTGQDFIYPDNFADPLAAYLQLTGQQDAAGNLLTSNPETSGRYHSAWLSMMLPRLFLARQLLRDDGVLFVSIDDHEVHHLRMLMNEIFGEENFVACCIWQKRYSRENRGIIGDVHDYIVVYARNIECFAEVRNLLPLDAESRSHYRNPNNDPNGPWQSVSFSAQGYRPNQMYTIVAPNGTKHKPPEGRCWAFIEPEYKKLFAAGRIWFGADGTGVPRLIRYLSEVEGLVPWTWWPHEEVGHTDEAKKEIHDFFGKEEAFDTPKPARLIKRMLQIGSKPSGSEIVLDFFAGSCTTAQAVLELNREDGGNRRFLMVQLPEPTGNKKFPTIAEIGKERIRRVIHRLKDETGDLTRTAPEDLGFKVFKLAASHFASWVGTAERDPANYHEQMSLFVDPLRAGWTSENVLWEVAIKEGYGLNSVVEPAACAVNTVYRVVDPERDPPQSFRACLDDTLHPDIAKALHLGADDLFVCRDRALDDTLAANLALQCRLKTI
jgi:adenine-specific DNA-methyltransferase